MAAVILHRLVGRPEAASKAGNSGTGKGHKRGAMAARISTKCRQTNMAVEKRRCGLANRAGGDEQGLIPRLRLLADQL